MNRNIEKSSYQDQHFPVIVRNELTPQFDSRLNELSPQFDSRLNELTPQFDSSLNELTPQFDSRLNELSSQFDSSLNDLGVHSRSRGHGKARTYAVTQLKSFMRQLKCS